MELLELILGKSCLVNNMSDKQFSYEIDYIINDGRRHLKIINRQRRLTDRADGKNYHAKMYRLQCLKCGWDNLWREECQLNRGIGCSCCAGQTVVPGINSVADTHPWIVDYFIGGYEEASKYTRGTSKKIVFKCPYCGRKSQQFLISNIIKNHGFACSCKLTTSFPERMLRKLLDKMGIEYICQLSKKHFSWVGNYRYDFYLPKYNAIIETHGLQHYKEIKYTHHSLEEEQENDKQKEILAKNNDISYYFVIDCSESFVEYIKESILNNEVLCSLLSITNESFVGLQLYDDNIYNDVCNLWNNTQNSINRIATELRIDREKVKDILILSAQNSHTNFSVKSMNYRKNLMVSQKSKPIHCVEKNLFFKNVYLCESLSNDIFGVSMYKNSVIYNLSKNKPYKGFTFEYISKEQFNKIKQESPELAFGDSFIL